MGLTVREVLERTRSEYLQPGNVNTESWDVQSGSITASATALTLVGVASYVPPKGFVEWDDDTMEIAPVRSVTGTAVTLASRGYLETDGATHADATRVIIDPVYPKKVLFNALKAVIASLRGYGLYGKGFTTSLTYSNTTIVALPSDAIDTLARMYVQNGSQWFPLVKGTHFEVLYDSGPLSTSPPNVRFFSGGTPGAALRIGYKKAFTQPTLLTDDLDTSGISTDLQQELAMGVAAHVLTGRDIPRLDAEHVRQAQANQGIPPGTRVSLARNLLSQFVSGAVMAERHRLMESNPVQVVFTPGP